MDAGVRLFVRCTFFFVRHTYQLNGTLYECQGASETSASPIWRLGRAEPGARQPRYTREQIAAAALAVADSEGIEARLDAPRRRRSSAPAR